MTLKQAFFILRHGSAEGEHKYFEAIKVIEDEYNRAMKALEKQIPKKPIEERYPWAICPTCGGSVYLKNVQELIQNQETTHCEHCGQALDWGDTE